MKIAMIGAGKWGLAIMGRFKGKALKATLSLRPLRQRARVTGHTKESACFEVHAYTERIDR